MKKSVCFILVSLSLLSGFSQEETEEKKFGIRFSGFVKNDLFIDSRQTVAAREGHFLLWPSPEKPDALGKDINAVPNLNILAVQSRLSGTITGPDAFGAKTSGVIEGDFFAQENININLFRLRHAFLKLNWKTTELISGQHWNPLFVTGCFPGTVSFNTGTPFQSFARNPQIRLTQELSNLKIIAAILSQRDYASRGELPDPTSTYLRNSAIPDMHFQLQYATGNEEKGISFLSGAGAAYKIIKPRLSSTVDTTYAVDEQVQGLTLIAYAKLQLKPVTFKIQGRYGENIPDVLSISGFAVKEVVDTVTGEQSYTPFRNLTLWGEVHTNGKTLQAGLFGGVLLNLGTKEPMSSPDNAKYGLGYNIAALYRLSPRVIYNSGKVRIALEVETTVAQYGKDYDVNYIPGKLSTVTNVRGLLSTYYFF